MSKKMQNLFSPDRLNSKWSTAYEKTKTPSFDEEIVEEPAYQPTQDIPSSWEKCRKLFYEDFEDSAGIPNLMESITTQLQKIFTRDTPLTEDEKSRLIHDISLFERLTEVQLFTRDRTMAMR